MRLEDEQHYLLESLVGKKVNIRECYPELTDCGDIPRWHNNNGMLRSLSYEGSVLVGAFVDLESEGSMLYTNKVSFRPNELIIRCLGPDCYEYEVMYGDDHILRKKATPDPIEVGLKRYIIHLAREIHDISEDMDITESAGSAEIFAYHADEAVEKAVSDMMKQYDSQSSHVFGAHATAVMSPDGLKIR